MGSDDEDVSPIGHRESGEGFELKDLSGTRNHLEKSKDKSDPELEDWESDHEKSPSPLRSRRASVSTVQSFMLYTPDEEKSVVKKFDRRLVLFIACLYMLSFLDRSSMYVLAF